jgi:cell division protein FtsW
MNFIQKNIKPIITVNKPDYILFFLSSLLIIVGVIFSYSLSIYTVEYYDYSQFHFFFRQLLVGIVAIFIMWLFAHIKPDYLFYSFKIGWILFGFFLALMIIMNFLPSSLVTQSGGANRWIRLPGFSLSPVEFFKIGFIYFLAFSFHIEFLNLKKISFKEELKLLAPYVLVFAVVVFLIAVLQKDLGQVVLLGSILFVMLIFANRSTKVFATIIGFTLTGVIALIVFAPHRMNRIYSWWSSVQDSILAFLPDFIANALRIKDFPEPYQVSHSLNAIYNGGWTGVGLSNGALKLGFLSEVHTDFVLAGITEEIGLIGLFSILIIFYIIIWRILRISKRINNPKYHLFTLGISLMLSIAFLINSYGISGIIPIKGIAVPFLSYGGSSILSIGIAIGLVLSISNDMPQNIPAS